MIVTSHISVFTFSPLYIFITMRHLTNRHKFSYVIFGSHL